MNLDDIIRKQEQLQKQLNELSQEINQLKVQAQPVSVATWTPPPPPTVTQTVQADHAVPPVIAPKPKETDSLEVKLGTFWLVRVGVVLLLTGLVFLTGYAYQALGLGAWGKLGLLYLGSMAFVGMGLYWDRIHSKLQQMGRVTLAGGLAGVYYVTFAAHHSETLRVIHSPWLAGALLMGLAVGILFLAERRGSPTIASMAVLLSLYSSSIQQANVLSLVSNLILSLASGWLLVKRGWSTVPWLAMVGSFFAFWFWQKAPQSTLSLDLPWISVSMLSLYWLLFSGIGFFAPASTVSAGYRGSFLSVNHLLFALCFFSLVEGQVTALASGLAVLFFLFSALGYRWHTHARVIGDTFLAGGLIFLTTASASYFSANVMPLMLAAQTLVLVACARLSENAVLRWGGYLTTPVFIVSFLAQLNNQNELVAGCSVLMLALASYWDQKDRTSLQLGALALISIAVMSVVAFTLEQVPKSQQVAVLSVFAVIPTLLWALHRQKHLIWIPQLVWIPALALALVHSSKTPDSWAWITPATLLIQTVALRYTPSMTLSFAPQASCSVFAYATVLWTALEISSRVPYVHQLATFCGLIVVLALGAWWLNSKRLVRAGLAFTFYLFCTLVFEGKNQPLTLWWLASLGLITGHIITELKLTDALPRWLKMAYAVLVGLVVWVVVHRWVSQSAVDFFLTVSWGGLASVFLVLGLALRLKNYRTIGLSLLLLTVLRLAFVDVWELDVPYRIISFMALGLLMVILGFLYAKNQEKIKSWL